MRSSCEPNNILKRVPLCTLSNYLLKYFHCCSIIVWRSNSPRRVDQAALGGYANGFPQGQWKDHRLITTCGPRGTVHLLSGRKTKLQCRFCCQRFNKLYGNLLLLVTTVIGRFTRDGDGMRVALDQSSIGNAGEVCLYAQVLQVFCTGIPHP